MPAGAELVMISDEAAASIDALIDRLRADVKRLARENADLAVMVKRLERQHLQDLDDLFTLQQQLAVHEHREG